MSPTAAAVVALAFGFGGHCSFIFTKTSEIETIGGVFGISGASLSRAAPAVRERRDVAAPSGTNERTHARSRRAASASATRCLSRRAARHAV